MQMASPALFYSLSVLHTQCTEIRTSTTFAQDLSHLSSNDENPCSNDTHMQTSPTYTHVQTAY